MKNKEQIITILFLLLFYKISDTGVKLISEPFKSQSGLWQKWTTDGSGESLVLPVETNEIRDILDSQKIEDFFLSLQLTQNTAIYQRTIESVFPRRFKETSPHHFYSKNESVPLHCIKMIQKSMVTFARCR